MSYNVHVTGRRAPMRFNRRSTADAYRQTIAATTGLVVWIETSG